MSLSIRVLIVDDHAVVRAGLRMLLESGPGMRVVGEGLKNRQIAQRLFLSETTVRHHLTAIFARLGVADRLELLIYASRHGLAQPPR